MQGAQDGEGVADRRGSGGAQQDGNPTAVAGVGGLAGAVREPQALGVGVDDRPDQVQLLQRGSHGPLAREALREVQRPEQRADVPLAHARHIGVHAALAQLQVVAGQLTQHPRQSAVAVGDGVRDEEGVRLGQLRGRRGGRGCGGSGHHDGFSVGGPGDVRSTAADVGRAMGADVVRLAVVGVAVGAGGYRLRHRGAPVAFARGLGAGGVGGRVEFAGLPRGLQFVLQICHGKPP